MKIVSLLVSTRKETWLPYKKLFVGYLISNTKNLNVRSPFVVDQYKDLS